MFESKPEGRRSKERSKLKWLEYAEKDLLEMMVKMATDSSGQKRMDSVIKEARQGSQRIVEPRRK